MLAAEAYEIVRFAAGETLRVAPVFLVSIAIGVLIRQLELDALVRRAFNARVGVSIVLATAVGAFSPFCSCTVIPVVSGLLLSGVPLAPVMSFWVASPTMDPEIFALSVGTLGWSLALTRLGATLVVSLAAGWLTLLLVRAGMLAGSPLRMPAARPVARRLAMVPVAVGGGDAGAASPSCCGQPGGPATKSGALASTGWWPLLTDGVSAVGWSEWGRGLAFETVRLGRWLVLAFVLEAFIVRYVPQAAIARVLGHETLFAVPLAALVGIPLYLNNVSALPIVSGLLAQGMQPGAAIAFLIAGPVTTIPAMAAVWGIARPRVFGLYLGVALGGAVVLGALANTLLG